MPNPQANKESPDPLILLNAITTGITICAVLVLANIRFKEGVGYTLIALAPAIVGLMLMSERSGHQRRSARETPN